MCNFRVGQKVVYAVLGAGHIRHVEWNKLRGYSVSMPVLGEVYTVREIFVSSAGDTVIRLVELVNPILPYKGETTEVRFRASNFRPVVTRKTDITIFKAMLTDQPERARA